MTLRTFGSILLILVANLLVKLWFLASNDIAHDEPFTLFFAQGNPQEIIQNLIPYNNPPLYELLLHYWIDIFGLEAFDARLFSCIISCLGAVALFLFAVQNWNQRIAWQAAIIYTFSTYQISFSHEARVYALFFLLTVLSFHFLILLLKERKTKYAILYVISTVLLLYAHFFSVWVILIQLIHLALRKKWPDRKASISLIIIFMCFLPYLKIIVQRFFDSSAKGTWVEPPSANAIYENIRHFSNEPLAAVLFLGLIFIGIFYYLKKKICLPHLRLIGIWFFVPYFLLFLISFKIPMFLGRYLIFITPAFILLIAILAELFYDARSKWKWLVFIPSALMIATVNINPVNEMDTNKTAGLIKPYYEKQVMIVLAPASNDIMLSYYLDRDLFTYRKNYREYERSKNYYAIDFISEVDLKDEIIYVETFGGGYLDKERKNFYTLKSTYVTCEELTINGEHPKGFSVYHFKELKSKVNN